MAGFSPAVSVVAVSDVSVVAVSDVSVGVEAVSSAPAFSSSLAMDRILLRRRPPRPHRAGPSHLRAHHRVLTRKRTTPFSSTMRRPLRTTDPTSIDVAGARLEAPGSTTWHLPADAAPIAPGSKVAFDVVVRNLLVGHRFPGGVLDIQDTWIEV